jgi:hypothetical protein
MPKGKGKRKGKKKGKGKKKDKEAMGPDSVVNKLFKAYQQNCANANSQMAPNVKKSLKQAIEDEKLVTEVRLTCLDLTFPMLPEGNGIKLT